jgi:hypothetical protein
MQRAAREKPNFAARVPIMFPSDVLSPVVGSLLERAEVQWHVVTGDDDSLMRFWLTFTGGQTYGFHVGADGVALDVIAEAPGIDADLGRYGKLEVRPAREPDPPASAVGQRLVGVENLFSGTSQSAIGARLSFETVTVSVADCDDELRWGHDRVRA